MQQADIVEQDLHPKITEAFFRHIREQNDVGAALTVWSRGETVVELQGGFADEAGLRPVNADTLFVLFSSSKPIGAVAMLILMERGQLDFDTPVCAWWPEFGQHGKEMVTIKHVLTHTGGFPTTPVDLKQKPWPAWSTIITALENKVVEYPPGTESAYHSLNQGWVIGELVQRIDGRPFAQFVKEEITGPLGMSNTHFGIEEASVLKRVAELVPVLDIEDDSRDILPVFNREDVHRAVIPAAGGISNTADMVKFYAMLVSGGTAGGARILKEETIELATQIYIDAEWDRALGITVRRGLGFNIGGYSPFSDRMGSTCTAQTFGHGGIGTSSCWADKDLQTCMAFVSNAFRGKESNDKRLIELSDLLRATFV